jgi:thioredoxin reductase (NADPH)
MARFIQEIDASQYPALVAQAKGPVILDFYSEDCVPCEALASKFESLAELFGEEIRFYKIFRQKNRELATDLGVRSSPTLIFYRDGIEVGRRLTGAIRKKDIVEQIRQLIPESTFERLYARRSSSTREVDVAILGGGPAGLTAALYAAQARLNVLVIDHDLTGGQVKTTHMISNYPGTGGPVSGWELSEKMLRQVQEAGADVISAVDVTMVKLKSGNSIIRLDDEIEVHARSVILATGAEPRSLNVPGEKEYRGKGISYCATCDGKYYDGKEVIVIGGGNSAVEESLFLTRFARKVTIVHQFDYLQANKKAQEEAFANDRIEFIWNSEPRRFDQLPDGRMKLTIENVKTGEMSELITDGVFVFVGMVPNLTGIESEVPLEKNPWGYIITDEDMETNIPGIYAVGDVRAKKYRQAAIAVGDVCIAAFAFEKRLEAMKQSQKELAGV